MAGSRQWKQRNAEHTKAYMKAWHARRKAATPPKPPKPPPPPTLRQVAQAAGLRHYEGTVCTTCSGTRRYTAGGSCVACAARNAIERLNAPGGRERHGRYTKKWHDRNKDKARANAARQREKNPDRVRAAKVRSESKRRAKKRGALVAVTKREIEAMMKASVHCPDCGAKFNRKVRKTLDHVMPLVAGGAHEISNLRVICLSCNSSKGSGRFTSGGQGILI
jgi:hypothetical protein